MKISVAIATYNGEMYLQEQLQSIADQCRLPDEVIVCDDGSSDRTTEIVSSFAKKMSFPIQLNKNPQNFGPSKNFQGAIARCNGEIIVLCDQDDRWYPQKLQCIEQTFLSSPDVGVVFSDADLIDHDGHSLQRRLWQQTLRGRDQKRVKTGKIFELLLQHDVVTGATMAFRSRFREMILPCSTDIPLLHHDGWIALIISAVADVGVLPLPLIRYRVHGQQHLGIRPINGRRNGHTNGQSALPARSAKYLEQLRKLRAVHERLSEMACKVDDPIVLDRLQGRIRYAERLMTHLHARCRLPRGRFKRSQIVFRELVTFRYHRFSRGLLSVARDLTI